MGSVDIPPFMREQMKKNQEQSPDVPPFLKKKNGSSDVLIGGEKPKDYVSVPQSTSQNEFKPVNPLWQMPESEQGEEDVVGLAFKAKELSGKKIYTNTGGAGALMGATQASEEKPDTDAIDQSNLIKQQLSKKGYDADKVYEDFHDIPQYAFNTIPKETLLKLYKDNPALYERSISTMKWQSKIHDQLFNQEKEGNLPKGVAGKVWQSIKNEINHSEFGDYSSQRERVRSIANMIKEYGGENSGEMLRHLGVDFSKKYGYAALHPEKTNALDEMALSGKFNSTELAAWQYLEDVSPEMLGKYKSALLTDAQVKDNYEAALAQQEAKKQLHEIGVQLGRAYFAEHPDDVEGLDYLNRAEEVKSARYPIATSYDARNFAQELLGQKNTGLNWLALEAGKATENTAKGIWNMAATPFRSDSANEINQAEILGTDIMNQHSTYLTQEKQMEQTFKPSVSPELQSKIDEIKNNKSLSYGQKEDAVTELLIKNGDKFDRKPIEGGKTNINLTSLSYGVGGLAANLAPFMLLETLTGGAATPSIAKKLTSTFVSAAATSFEDAYAQAIKEGAPNPYSKAMRVTAINSAAMAGAMTPDAIRKMLLGKNKAIGELVGKMTDDEIMATLKNTPKPLKQFKDGLKQFGGEVLEGGKSAAKLTAFTTGGQILNDAISGELKSPQEYAKQGMIETLKFGVFSAISPTLRGVKKIVKPTDIQLANVMAAAKMPESYLPEVDKLEREGDLSAEDASQIRSNIEKVSSIYNKSVVLKNSNITDAAKREYLYNEMVKQDAKESAASLPQKQAEEANKKALIADYKNSYILEPKSEAQLAKRKEQLEKELIPEKDADGKEKPINEKLKFETEAEISAIDEILEEHKKAKDAGITIEPPMKGAGVTEIGEAATIKKAKDAGISIERPLQKTIVIEVGSEDPIIKKLEGNELLKNIEGTDAEKIKYLQEQSISAPESFSRKINDEATHIDLIAKNKVEDIEAAIEYQQKRLSEDNADIEVIDKGITVLEKGLDKAKKLSTDKESIPVSESKEGVEDAGVVQNILSGLSNSSEMRKNAPEKRQTLIDNGYAEIDLTPLSYNERIDVMQKILDRGEQPIIYRKDGTTISVDRTNFALDVPDLPFTVLAKEQSLSTKPEINNEATQEPIKADEPVLTEEVLQTEGKTAEAGEATGKEAELTGITHAETNKIAKELGFDEYQEKPETIEQWNAEAEARIKKGYNVESLLSKMEKDDYMPDKIEQRILAKYIASLKAKINKSASDADIAELKRTIDLSNIMGGREVAKSLRARQEREPVEETLADYFVTEMEDAAVDVLTAEQKAKVEKEYQDIKSAKEALEVKVKQLEEQALNNAAAKKVASSVPKEKKTKEYYAKEREKVIDSIKSTLKKIKDDISDPSMGIVGKSQQPLPYAKELYSVSKDVAKLVSIYAEQGVSKLTDVIDNIHEVLKENIDGIRKEDVRDLIAGVYNDKRKSKTELQLMVADLKYEAQLRNKLEMLEKGELPKDAKKKVERNREIKDLQEKIKKIYSENRQLNKFQKEEISEEQKTVEGHKNRLRQSIKEIEKQLESGDFSTNKKPEVKLDKDGKELLNKLISLRRERDIRRMKLQYENRNKFQKGVDKVLEVFNIPRSIMASTDFSAPLNQAIVATTAYPKLAKEAASQMFKSAFSQKEFDRWFYDLKEQPRYELMEKLKLGISDPHSPFLTAKEEAFMSGYAEQIPVAGSFIKGSERAYVQYLNKMRVDLFNKFIDRYESQGKTYKNSKRLYEKTAKYINNITGRGDLGKLEQYAPVFNTLLFSPRLMASRLNLLNPYYFATLPKELKMQYAKDMGTFIGLGTTLLGAFALYGKTQNDDDKDKITVETDVRSSDFGKIKQGNTRWNIWGGFQPYVRLAGQITSGERKSSSSGTVQKLDGEGAFGTTRMDVTTSFFRGKLAPVPSMAVDFLGGRTATGEKVEIKDELLNHIIPLSVSGIIEAWKQYGVSTIYKVGVPSIFGVGTQTYGERELNVKDTIKYEGRDVKLNEEQFNFYKKEAEARVTKDLETLKKLNDYKSLSPEEKVSMERLVKQAAMKKAQAATEKKYKHQFPKETKEERDERKRKEKSKESIKKQIK